MRGLTRVKMEVVSGVFTRMRLVGLGVVVLFACTRTDPPSEKKRKDGVIQVTPKPEAAAQSRPHQRPLEEAPNWRWEVLEEGQSLRPDSSWSERPFGTWFPLDVAGAEVEYARLEQEGRDTRLLGLRSEGLPSEKVLWQFDFPGEVAVATVVRSMGPHHRIIVVAHHSPIASGARLTGINAYNGAAMWEIDLEGLGPVDHSKYRNEVQLELRGREVIVYGRESQGRYVEVRRVSGGRLLAHERIDPLGPETIPAGDSRVTDRPQDGCDLTRIARSDGIEFQLTFCFISSGGTLTAIDTKEERELWKVDLRGLGRVAHSEYFANYKLYIHEGNPMVTGWESAGSFLEIRDAKTGGELWSIVKRD